MDWGTAAVNGMEERDRVDASTNICSRPVAITGRKHLRPRPVDFVILFSVLDPWLLLAGDISALARLDSFIFAELLHDYCCLLLELLCAVCFCFMLI